MTENSKSCINCFISLPLFIIFLTNQQKMKYENSTNLLMTKNLESWKAVQALLTYWKTILEDSFQL